MRIHGDGRARIRMGMKKAIAELKESAIKDEESMGIYFKKDAIKF